METAVWRGLLGVLYGAEVDAEDFGRGVLLCCVGDFIWYQFNGLRDGYVETDVCPFPSSCSQVENLPEGFGDWGEM